MASAPDPAPVKRMEELLTCCVCQETLNEPTTLPCFHSFCKKCLARYVKIQRDDARREGRAEHLFKCPTCRTQFQLRQTQSVERLPSNHFINNLLDILKIQQEAQKLPCDSCSGQLPAECRCVQCESYLCQKCLKTHNNWPAFKSHDVLTLEELTKPENQAKAKAKPRCHKDGHENKPLEYYCKTCQQLACITCVLLNHPNREHDCQPISVVAEQQKEDLKTTSASLKEKSDESQNALQKVKRATENLQDNVKKAKDAILRQEEEILEEFTKKLKRNTAALIHEVDRKHDDISQKLVKQHDDMKAYVEKVNGSLEFAKNIIEKGSNVEIIAHRNKIKSNANNIEMECPESMRPVHYGFFEYQQKKSIKNIVDIVDLSDLGEIIDEPPPVQPLLGTSTILDGDNDLAQQLVQWMEDKKFRWQRCYQASRDGWGSKDFHGKCDDIGPTITLVKCGTNIFGGFTDQSWESPPMSRRLYYSALDGFYTRSYGSFVFSLRNKDNLLPFKCMIDHARKGNAICSDPRHGAIFGRGDLHISKDANTNQNSFSNLGMTYQPPPGYEPGTPQTKALLAGSEYFTPSEIEVFHG